MLCSLGKTSNLVLLVLQEHVIMYTCLQHQGTCRYVFCVDKQEQFMVHVLNEQCFGTP